MDIVKTNLGKWKYEFQSYHEHAETVWVFRQLLLSPFFYYLQDQLGDIHDLNLKDDLKKIFKIETLYHDYDKLYIEAKNVANLKSFNWHADVNSNENKIALDALLADEIEIASKLIDGDLFEDDDQVKDFLRNANVAHDGRITNSKWENAKKTYSRLFSALLGNEFESIDMDVITNWLCYSIRVADSIASSSEERVSYKSDVSKYTDLVHHAMPNAKVYIHSISFNTVFSESSSATVLQGYYTLYDAAYKSLTDILEFDGVAIMDNSRTIVGMELSENSQDEFKNALLNRVSGKLTNPQLSSIDNLLQISTQTVDILSNIVEYDKLIKTEVLNAIFSSFNSEDLMNGFSCASCGRSVITNKASKELPKALKEETLTLESRGDFGIVKSIGKIIHETKSLDKSALFLCDDCITLANFVNEGHLIKKHFTTISISELERYYKPTCKDLNLTNKAGKELQTAILPKLIYGFKRKQDLLSKIKQEVQENPKTNLIASSFIILEYTNTPQKMWNNFVDPLLKCLEPIVISLPDGQLIYEANYGIRIGTGPMFYEKQIVDNEFLKGLYNFNEYGGRFESVKNLDKLLSKIDNGPKENAVLVSNLNTNNLPSLIKDILKIDMLFYSQRKKPKLDFDDFISLSTFIKNKPDSIAYLRQVRNANKLK